MKDKYCSNCGSKLENDQEKCPKCGAPIDKNETPQKVEITKEKIRGGIPKKKIIIGLISIVIIILVIFGGTSIHNKRIENKAKMKSIEYKTNLAKITNDMLIGVASSEDCGNKIKKVWSNTIWEENDPETDKYTKDNGEFKDDFNDSLSSLFADPDFIKITSSVKQSRNDVNSLMKKMKNPPEEWKDAYNDLKDYYDKYLTITNLCTNPTGNLQTYSTNFSNADNDAVNGYYKVMSYLDY